MIKIDDVHIGKVRDSIILNNGTRIAHTSDRVSAFDFIFPFLVPRKGEILQTLSVWNFKSTRHIIENHVLGVLDSQNILVKNAQVFPIEIIVRGYLSGSLWRLYEKKGPQGVKDVYDITLADNMQQNQKFTTPLLTPSTKALFGHDLPITCKEAARTVGEEHWKIIAQKALELFSFGSEQALKRGLILVDTKYEMGLYDNRIILVDEIHTPDSSRYWYQRDESTTNPVQISKEFLREELIKIIGKPEELTLNPVFHPALQDKTTIQKLTLTLAKRYLELFNLFIDEGASVKINAPTAFIPWPISKNECQEAILSHTLPKKTLVVGNGGRDYTLFSQLCDLTEIEAVYCAAGNREWMHLKYKNCPTNNVTEIAQFAKDTGVGLVIAGPEAPIAQGLQAACAQFHIPVLAPTLECASLESSKILCKQLILDAGINTASSNIVGWSELRPQLISVLENPTHTHALTLPCVIKYDGLAAGKGVFVVKNMHDVKAAFESIEQNLSEWNRLSREVLTPTYSKQKGEPCFLIETMLEGEELSAIALCNGENFRLLPIAKDYKRRNDNQQGPNTGGMGSIAPVAVPEDLLNQINSAFSKTLKELVKRKTPYYGFLFAGFMIDKNGQASLLEYNCRLGDPETQVILPGLGREFYAELYQTAQQKSFFAPEKSGTFFHHDGLKRMFVVAASPEYPEKSAPKRKLVLNKKYEIDSQCKIDFVPSSIEAGGMTSGGRAFGILATAPTFEIAHARVYQALDGTKLENPDGSFVSPHYRTDIGS